MKESMLALGHVDDYNMGAGCGEANMKGFILDCYVMTFDELVNDEGIDEKVISWAKDCEVGDSMSLGACGDLMCVGVSKEFTNQ